MIQGLSACIVTLPSPEVGSSHAVEGLQHFQPFHAHMTLSSRTKGTTGPSIFYFSGKAFSEQSSSKGPASHIGQNQVDAPLKPLTVSWLTLGVWIYSWAGENVISTNTRLHTEGGQEGKGRLLSRQWQNVQNTLFFYFIC